MRSAKGRLGVVKKRMIPNPATEAKTEVLARLRNRQEEMGRRWGVRKLRGPILGSNTIGRT